MYSADREDEGGRVKIPEMNFTLSLRGEGRTKESRKGRGGNTAAFIFRVFR